MSAQLRLICTAAIATASVVTIAAQLPMPPRDARAGQAAQAVGTAVVTGRVTMMGSGQPARRVRVNLSGAEIRGSRAALTDDEGQFSFTGLPAGRYTLSASRPGHLTVSYGQQRPGRPGTPIELSDGEKFHAALQIPKGSVVTGTVLDEHGEATPQVSVRALRFAMQNGERTLLGTNAATTDDRGRYRIYGLMPGDYIVCATPRNNTVMPIDRSRIELESLQQALASSAAADDNAARAIRDRIATVEAVMSATADQEPPPGYSPVCYPGTTSTASAAVVTVGVAEERTAVDFQLQLARLATIEGTVMTPDGAQVRNIQVRLTESHQLGQSLFQSTARANAEGNFRIPNVPPGQYRLTARGAMPPVRSAQTAAGRGGAGGRGAPEGRGAAPTQAAALWAMADVFVDGQNVPNVILALQPGITVSGEVRFEGTSPQPPDLTRLRVTMTSTVPGPFGGATAGRVDASGRFTIAGVTPGQYRLTATGAAGWSLESAAIGGQDALDIPIEVKGDRHIGGAVVTFTDRQTELTGTMVDGNSQPAVGFTLVVFPSDQRFWTRNARRIQSLRPSTDGQFVARNLPPGEYLLAPVVDLPPGVLYDAAFLQQLEATALRVTLYPGERKVQDIRLR